MSRWMKWIEMAPFGLKLSPIEPQRLCEAFGSTTEALTENGKSQNAEQLDNHCLGSRGSYMFLVQFALARYPWRLVLMMHGLVVPALPSRPGLVPALSFWPCSSGLVLLISLSQPCRPGLAVPALPSRPCQPGLAHPASSSRPPRPGLPPAKDL